MTCAVRWFDTCEFKSVTLIKSLLKRLGNLSLMSSVFGYVRHVNDGDRKAAAALCLSTLSNGLSRKRKNYVGAEGQAARCFAPGQI